MKWLTLSLLSMVVCFFIFCSVYTSQQRYNQQLKSINDSLHITNDSLHDELFVKGINDLRYEITLDYLKEIDSATYQKVIDFYENDTE